MNFFSDGYFSEYRWVPLHASEITWLNISREPLPAQTAVIKGYVKNPQGTPLASVRVKIDDQADYANDTTTDVNG